MYFLCTWSSVYVFPMHMEWYMHFLHMEICISYVHGVLYAFPMHMEQCTCISYVHEMVYAFSCRCMRGRNLVIWREAVHAFNREYAPPIHIMIQIIIWFGAKLHHDLICFGAKLRDLIWFGAKLRHDLICFGAKLHHDLICFGAKLCHDLMQRIRTMAGMRSLPPRDTRRMRDAG